MDLPKASGREQLYLVLGWCCEKRHFSASKIGKDITQEEGIPKKILTFQSNQFFISSRHKTPSFTRLPGTRRENGHWHSKNAHTRPQGGFLIQKWDGKNPQALWCQTWCLTAHDALRRTGATGKRTEISDTEWSSKEKFIFFPKPPPRSRSDCKNPVSTPLRSPRRKSDQKNNYNSTSSATQTLLARNPTKSTSFTKMKSQSSRLSSPKLSTPHKRNKFRPYT